MAGWIVDEGMKYLKEHERENGGGVSWKADEGVVGAKGMSVELLPVVFLLLMFLLVGYGFRPGEARLTVWGNGAGTDWQKISISELDRYLKREQIDGRNRVARILVSRKTEAGPLVRVVDCLERNEVANIQLVRGYPNDW